MLHHGKRGVFFITDQTIPEKDSLSHEKEIKKEKWDLRKQKTRKALEKAFLELTETKWIEDISVRDICDRAMVRRATFYKHFEDKYDFFAYVMNNMQRSTNLALNANPKDITMAEYCANICYSYYRNNREHPKLVSRIYDSKSRQLYSDILMDQIRDAIRKKAKYDLEKGIRQEIQVDVLASFIGGAIPNVMTAFEKKQLGGIDAEAFLAELRKIFEKLCAPMMLKENPESSEKQITSPP